MQIRAWVFWILFSAVSVHGADPKNDSRRITLEWNALEHAHSYEIEIASRPEFEHRIFRKKIKSLKTQAWLHPGTYYYRVRGLDENHHAGPWSPVQGFIVNPFPPDLLEPEEDAISVVQPVSKSVLFSWSDAQIKPKHVYWLEVHKNDSGKNLILRQKVEGTQYEWKPKRTGIYVWRVGFEDIGGEEWSAFRKIRVQNPAEKVVLEESLENLPGEEKVLELSPVLNQSMGLFLGLGSSYENLQNQDSAFQRSSTHSIFQTRLNVRSEIATRGWGYFEVEGSAGFIKRFIEIDSQTLPRTHGKVSFIGNLNPQLKIGPVLRLGYRREAMDVGGRLAKFGRTEMGGGIHFVWEISERFQTRVLALLRRDGGADSSALPHSLESSWGWEWTGSGIYNFDLPLFLEAGMELDFQRYEWKSLTASTNSHLTRTDVSAFLGLGYRF